MLFTIFTIRCKQFSCYALKTGSTKQTPGATACCSTSATHFGIWNLNWYMVRPSSPDRSEKDMLLMPPARACWNTPERGTGGGRGGAEEGQGTGEGANQGQHRCTDEA